MGQEWAGRGRGGSQEKSFGVVSNRLSWWGRRRREIGKPDASAAWFTGGFSSQAVQYL